MDTGIVLENVEKSIGYVFNNKELLLEALTHSSFSNEMKINKRPDYERLEFLGDAVLELISSEYLYNLFPTVPEGGLSKKRAAMVCENSLSLCAQRMGLQDAIFFGKGEESSGGRKRPSVLCDVCESVLGAIYLDGGMEPSKNYVYNHILKDLQDSELFVDFKSEVQEYIQRVFPGQDFMYKVLDESGPDHDKSFLTALVVDDEIIALGKGKSKKNAEQEAARNAISIFKNRNK